MTGWSPDGLRRADEADRPVQAGVVRDGQPGQPQLDGPLDQVVRRGRPVEEREVGVAVEFGVRGRCHGSLRVGSRLTGGRQYRTSVLSMCAAPGRRGTGRIEPAGFPWVMRSPIPRVPPVLARPRPAPRVRRRHARRTARDVDPVPAAVEIRPRITGIAPLSKEVYGYLPYWRLDSGTVDRLQYDLVSTIAFFGLGIMADGNLDTAWVGYKEYVGDDVAAITNAAHDKGVRVVPTFQLFDSGSLTKMSAFLASTAAQTRFITPGPGPHGRRARPTAPTSTSSRCSPPTRPPTCAFVAKFRTAMKARFPSATLVNATSAGAGKDLILGLVPLVDQQMIMTYGYRTATATVAGAVAPLDNDDAHVKQHITRILQWAPAKTVILGVPYYGYDWPVTSTSRTPPSRRTRRPTAPVDERSPTPARDFLAAHPEVVRQYDARRGQRRSTPTGTPIKQTFRQVYFEDERSLDAKYDYALTTGLAGIGIWTLDNDRGYPELWDAAPLEVLLRRSTR